MDNENIQENIENTKTEGTTNDTSSEQTKKRPKKRINISFIIAGVLVLFALIQIVSTINESGGFQKIKIQKYSDDSITAELRNIDAAKPEFSAESGFYDDDFLLTISGPADCQIFYTLDGSDPAGSKMAELYEEPLQIRNNNDDKNILSARRDYALGSYLPPRENVEKGMIVRAVIKGADGIYGPTVTKSYFVGKDAPYYQSLKVISLVTNPYNIIDEDTGIYVSGSMYTKWRRSKEFNPMLEDWNLKNPTNYNQKGKEWEREADVAVFEEGKLAYEQKVGVRLAGNVSRSNVQKSFRLYAREEYGDTKLRYKFFNGLTDAFGKSIKKFDKITLRNEGNDTTSAYVRDDIIQLLVKDRAISVQAEEPCVLFLDGEYWGTYHIKERLEDYYFQSHYDIPKENVVIIKNSSFEGDEATIEAYKNFFNWAMYADFTDDASYEKACSKIDMQSFMDYFVIETYINNNDWLCTTTNNCMMWCSNVVIDGNPYADGKWRFALFDTEYSTNLYLQNTTSPQYDRLNNLYTRKTWCNPAALFLQLMKNQNFRDDFYKTYIEIMDECFDPEHVNEVVDNYIAEYGEAIAASLNRYLGTGTSTLHLNNQLESFRDFFRERPEYAREYLTRFFDNH